MGHSPWEFMHDLHIAEMYRPPNAVNLLLFTHALLHKELRKNYKGIRWRLTVVQGHSRSSKLVPSESPCRLLIGLSSVVSEI